MSKKEKAIVVTISPDGAIKIAVEGAKGSECLGMTADLEKQLGIVSKRVRCDGHSHVELQSLQQQKG